MNSNRLIGSLGLALTLASCATADMQKCMMQDQARHQRWAEIEAASKVREENTGPVTCDRINDDNERVLVAAPSEYWCRKRGGLTVPPGEWSKCDHLSADGTKIMCDIWTCTTPSADLKLACNYTRTEESGESDPP